MPPPTDDSPLSQHDDDVVLRVWAKPKASRTKILGVREGALEIALAAPPVDGAANETLLKFLQKTTGLTSARVELIQGETSRHKRVRLRGAERAVIAERLGLREDPK